ncbi:MAG: hypothetical protein QHH15_08300, partial [Candidatus Thermoplasmatota archaeon]|nr:hypothetical protein [Candidatus Thermoplasmatota archaeon]
KQFAQVFINIANALNCSYWIEEANATADVVGLDRELYIAFLSGRYRDLAAGYNNKGYSPEIFLRNRNI